MVRLFPVGFLEEGKVVVQNWNEVLDPWCQMDILPGLLVVVFRLRSGRQCRNRLLSPNLPNDPSISGSDSFSRSPQARSFQHPKHWSWCFWNGRSFPTIQTLHVHIAGIVPRMVMQLPWPQLRLHTDYACETIYCYCSGGHGERNGCCRSTVQTDEVISKGDDRHSGTSIFELEVVHSNAKCQLMQ